MAGMCPGVGVPQRRKTMLHQNQSNSFSESSTRERRQLSVKDFCSMDETTLKARQRLEQKLCYLYYNNSRSSEQKPDRSNGRNIKPRVKDTRILGSKLLGRSWLSQLCRCKSHRKVCSVCLEDFQGEQQVMDLSCSHKYHSDCLRPWLQTHPHCPYCRTPVQL